MAIEREQSRQEHRDKGTGVVDELFGSVTAEEAEVLFAKPKPISDGYNNASSSLYNPQTDVHTFG